MVYLKKTKKYGMFSIILRNSFEYFNKSKGWGVLEQAFAVAKALSLTIGIIAIQKLFDRITYLSTDSHALRQIAVSLILVCLILIGQQLIDGFSKYLLSKISYSNMGKFMVDFQNKLSRLPAVKFEDINFLNDINKAKDCLEYETLGHFASMCLQIFTYYFVFFVSIAGYLFFLSPILPLVIVVAFIPSILGQLAQVKVFTRLEEENAQFRRESDYYHKTITDRSYFKETRILGAFKYFKKLFSMSLQTKIKNTWQVEFKIAILQLALSIISFIGLGISILILFDSTITGRITIGAFISVFTSLTQIFSTVDEMVSIHVSGGSEALSQVTNYYKIMDANEVNGEKGTPNFTDGIISDNVSFTYPSRLEPSIHEISFSINKGETIALVGENGSGKSTLIRLLAGLYTPNIGSVTIGGLDSKKIHPKDLYKKTSAVFQHYQRYKMTLRDNVSISDISTLNHEKIEKSLDLSDFNKESATLDTMLSPEYGGVDLSGGQWQRIAIARGLYRDHDFIILDEPTSSIDPIEEARLYNQFGRLTKDKCAVIVTHRLGSVKLADRIVVMDNGKISDIGTHDELLTRNGKYAEMWNAQAKWYIT